MEYILCSAIYYNNGIKYPNQPKNISEGIVVCGFGHGDCILLLAQIFPDLSYKENYTEGFLTSIRRYVDREEAGMLAIKSGQIKELKHFGGKELDSSDLFNSNPPVMDIIDFLDSIRDYERESGKQICFDERTSEELYNEFKKNR